MERSPPSFVIDSTFSQDSVLSPPPSLVATVGDDSPLQGVSNGLRPFALCTSRDSTSAQGPASLRTLSYETAISSVLQELHLGSPKTPRKTRSSLHASPRPSCERKRLARSRVQKYRADRPPPCPPPSEEVPPTPASISDLVQEIKPTGVTFSAQRVRMPPQMTLGVDKLVYEEKRPMGTRKRLLSLFRGPSQPPKARPPSPLPPPRLDPKKLPLLLSYERERKARNDQRLAALASLEGSQRPSEDDAGPPVDEEAEEQLERLRREREYAQWRLIDQPTPGNCGGLL